MKKKIFFILIFIAIYLLFKYCEDGKLISVENFKKHQIFIENFVNQNYISSATLFILIYFFISSLPIPGDSALAIIGGYLFGIFCGLFFSLFAVTIAAISTFLVFKYLFKNHEENKFNIFIKNEIEKRGYIYLLSLRLLPILPVSVVNVIASLTQVKLSTFIWTTFVGMIPILFIYVNIGNQMHQLIK